MNKYLLLRDNKQSGPYSVPEIVAMGIKPYDLVWLEGKSAAWRYPSEVEELKAYAPAVEEQPFDRFYKKPEAAVKTTAPALTQAITPTDNHEDHTPYEPKITTTPEETSHRKVYINFPGRPAAISEAAAPIPLREEKPVQPEIKPLVAEVKKTPAPAYPDRTIHQQRAFAADPDTDSLPVIPVAKKTNNKLLYGAAAACLFLLLFAGVLLFNYNKQQNDLQKLNTIVQQMENREKAQTAVPTTLVQPSTPVEPVTEQTANREMTDHNTPLPEAPLATEKPAASKRTPAASNKQQDEPAMVFHENKTPGKSQPPAAEKTEKQDAPPSSGENVYKLVTVKPNAFKTGVLGGISNLKFEITNNSQSELQRVAIDVKYLGPEKKVVNRQTVYFENVAPGAQQTIEVPRSSRGVSIDYVISDIKSQVEN